MRMNHKLQSLLWVALSALLVSLSRLPLHCGWLVFVGWIPLLHVLPRPELRLWQAAAVFALIYISIIFSWIGLVTPGGVFGIGVVYFLFYWLCYYLIREIGQAFPAWRYTAFIAVLLSFEFVQNFGETRFPWFHIAYSLSDYQILIQAAELGGVILISALVLGVNVLLYQVVLRRWRYLYVILVLFILWFGQGYLSQHTLKLEKHDARIGLMQPSIPQDDKWDAAFYQQILKRYDELCAKAEKDSTRLLIFPEAAMPVYLISDWNSLNVLQDFTRKYKLDIFTGFPHYEYAPPQHVNKLYFYNAASLFKPDGSIGKLYYKNILVPVGERMLWLDYFPFLWSLQFGQANWEFGREQRWYESGGYEFSPSICYEIAFAGLHQKMAIPRDTKNGKLRKTDFLANITNDAWFGTSYGPWLHGLMTKFRAVENRIQIYRSANSGISMIVSPTGEVLRKAGLFEITNLSAPLYTCSRIPLYRHIAWYPWLIVGLVILLFGLSLLSGKQRKLQ